MGKEKQYAIYFCFCFFIKKIEMDDMLLLFKREQIRFKSVDLGQKALHMCWFTQARPTRLSFYFYFPSNLVLLLENNLANERVNKTLTQSYLTLVAGLTTTCELKSMETQVIIYTNNTHYSVKILKKAGIDCRHRFIVLRIGSIQ